ncbi:hypothetical protein WJX72_008519 [[Myrmecia] bisecta]|uniref:tRNA dimethylallyltransferase n=1 Tax=[Myrmecia] bisecta TaxID=41462 RepID=A0AAW1R8F1_9CHLO
MVDVVVVLTGATAVGKTHASLALAERLNGEIISADSVQVYTGLDIGSDKIPVDQRLGIPHHLIDVLPPHKEFSAGDFYRLARQATRQVLQRGRTPIVVGGTGFYLRWFVHGPPATPKSDEEGAVKAQSLLQQAWAAGTAAKGQELTAEEKWAVGVQQVELAGDPAAAIKLQGEPNNYYRLGRVLEVVLRTGLPMADMALDATAPLDYDFRCFFLNRPRLQLYDRIALRCESMLEGGLLEEAQQLLDSGIGPDQNTASRAIGYRQALQFLKRCHQQPDALTDESLVQLLRDIQTQSRKLCHRQLHWFRQDPMYRWLDATQSVPEVVDTIAAYLDMPQHQGGGAEAGVLSKEELRQLKGYQPQLHRFCQPERLSSRHACAVTGLWRSPDPTKTRKAAPELVCKTQQFGSFNELLNQSKVPILVDFYAQWCGPCQAR